MYRAFIKRVLDVIFAIVLLILLWPLLVLISVAIRIDSRGPAIFKQARLGLNGRVFQIYKFRSMCVDAESMESGVYAGKDDARVTRVGRFLRASSMDELPQIWNVLKGDMSFIGPRPPLTYHPWPIEAYTEEQRKMFRVRPGMTGWAQIHGRKRVAWQERIRLSVWYAENLSLWADVKIFFVTIVKVLTNADNEEIDPPSMPNTENERNKPKG